MQNFKDGILILCNELNIHKLDVEGNEQATKEHLIGPFFKELGWKRDPKTWRAEYDADFNGRKKGEKVDYAILNNNEPLILIECKPYSSKEKSLSARDGQLARYFAATSAQIAVITNGIVYRFFTDIEKPNIQDTQPFFVFDCSNPSDSDIDSLEKFTSSHFDAKLIKEWAVEHQFLIKVKNFLINIVSKPNEAPGFAYYLLEHTYSGPRSQKVIGKLNEHLGNLMNQVLGEEIKNRFSSAPSKNQHLGSNSSNNDHGIITTEEEIRTFQTIRGILVGAGYHYNDIIYKDMKQWMNISYKKGNNWFVRLLFNDVEKGILVKNVFENIETKIPKQYYFSIKGKNTFVKIEPNDIIMLSNIIKLSFDLILKSKDTSFDDENEEVKTAI